LYNSVRFSAAFHSFGSLYDVRTLELLYYTRVFLSQNSRRYYIFCAYVEETDKVSTFLFFPVESVLRAELVFRYAEAMGIFRSLLDWQIYLMIDLMDYYWIAAIAASSVARICTQTRQDVCHHHRPNNSQTQ
jgi:hypothetical protein